MTNNSGPRSRRTGRRISLVLAVAAAGAVAITATATAQSDTPPVGVPTGDVVQLLPYIPPAPVPEVDANAALIAKRLAASKEPVAAQLTNVGKQPWCRRGHDGANG